MNKLFELFTRRHDYDENDSKVIESLHLEAISLEALNEMKATGGWKILSDKLREELQKLIIDEVKNDPKIQILLQILSTVETKEASKLLEDEVSKIIPT